MENTMLVTWDEYKAQASADLRASGAYIYRGQRDAGWALRPTLYRTSLVRSYEELKMYADYVLPQVHEKVEAWVGRAWDLSEPTGLAEFLAFIQHNGFPTPLLDWTKSPYVAAYFAFESLDPFSVQSEYVSIYAFDQKLWCNAFTQHYDFGEFTPHVSVLSPRIVGNHKLAVQQGCFTWSTVPDIEQHIRTNETDERKFLRKFTLHVNERVQVMRELTLMGISAIQLMPCVESVCKAAYEDLLCMLPTVTSQSPTTQGA